MADVAQVGLTLVVATVIGLGVLAMTRSIAVEYAKRGVRANCAVAWSRRRASTIRSAAPMKPWNTSPQWTPMPISQTASPRAEETLSVSPLLIPFSAANSRDSSRKFCGTASSSQGVLRVMRPVCQCSVTRYVVATNG